MSVPSFAIIDAGGAWLYSPLPAAPLPTWSRWAVLLANTLTASGIATSLALVAGLPIALLITRTNLPGRQALAALILLAACLPLYVGAIFTLALVPAVHLAGSAVLCGLVSGVLFAPLAAIVLIVALRTGEPVLEAQALLDGSPSQVAMHVIVPQARGAVGATALLLFVLITGDALISDLLAVRTFAEEVYAEFMLDPTRVGPVLSAIPMTIALGLALLVLIRAETRPTPAAATQQPVLMSLGRSRAPLAAITWLAVGAALLTPLIAVGMRVESLAVVGPAAAAAFPSVLTSVGIGLCAATIVAALAPGLATLAMARRATLGAIGVALVLLVATPAPVVGVALVRLFNRPGPLGNIYDSPAIIVIGHVVRLLPFGVALLLPAVARVPRALADSARIDGCGWLGMQRRLVWPLTRRTILLAWLIVMLLSFAEVNVSKLVAPPGWETAAGLAFTLLHFGVYRDLAVLALLSTLAVCAIWGGLAALLSTTLSEDRT